MIQKILLPILIVVTSGCKINHVASVEPQVYTFVRGAGDQEMNQIIDPYKTQLEKDMNQVIGFATRSLTKHQPESTLGNWIADIIYQKGCDYYEQSIDMAFQNYGGIRIQDLPDGAITKSHIFELMPFDNMLVILEVDAENLIKLFNRIAAYGGWPVSRQVKFEIKNGHPENIRINNQPIDKNRIYKVGLPDYIANGGDKCFFLKDLKRTTLNIMVRDAIIEYVVEETKRGNSLNAKLEGRIRLKN